MRRLKMHRLYDAVTTDYDVALIEMDREIEYAPEIRPVCLLLPEEEGDVDYTGDYVAVTACCCVIFKTF